MRLSLAAAPVFFIALLLSGCATNPTSSMPAPQEGRAPKHKVIAYVTGRADFSRISVQKLTHINYAFGLVNTNGEAFVRPNTPSHLAQLQALKARNPNLKINLSIGGWGADHFSDAALTEDSRQKFARSCLSLLKEFALDGIDLDWEYPGQPGPGIKFRPEDKENFTAMLRELRAQLEALSDARHRVGSDRYTLTIASAGGKYFEHTEMDKLHAYLDWINIMTYDFFGQGSGPGHHAGLHNPTGGTARRTTESDVQDHLHAGIPASKLVVGAAFYAKSWTNVTSLNPPTGGKFSHGFSYAVLSRDILPNKTYERHWDEAAQAAYLWNPETKTFISFEDEKALKAKCDFVKTLHLAGVMFWEYSEDPDEVLLDALSQELR
jgi:chitinase